jgi:NTE family protein
VRPALSEGNPLLSRGGWLRALSLAALLALLLPTAASAAERPKTGLVLAGGGARGAAHVGVLKVLEELRVPVDVIAGTSMGSIVGGLYASGMSVDEIEHTLKTLDWSDKLEDDVDRADDPIARKQIEDAFPIKLRPGLKDGKITFPEGLIYGQKVLPTLQRLVSSVDHITNFDELAIPFRAVATDITSGNMVVLSGGDLALSMRASMAVPSLFTPVEIGGVYLVDGGMTNNIPVDIAKEMGADVVIVVDISTPYRTREELGNLLQITDQLMRFLTGVNSQQRLAMLKKKDVLIKPVLGDITSSDFDRADEAIPIGEEAANEHLTELRQYALSPQNYQAHIASRNPIPPVNRTIRSISLNNNSGLDDRLLEQFISTRAGQTLDTEQLEQDLHRVHGLGNFQTVSYTMDHTKEGIDLTLDAAAKSWGPNYLHFGVVMEGDMEGDTLTNFTLGYSREELNDRGAISTSYITLGAEPEISTRIYQPLSYELGPFVSGTLASGRKNQAIYDDKDHKLAEYRLKQTEVMAGIGWEFNRQNTILAGVERITGKADVLIGDPALTEPRYDDGGVFVRYRFDSLDDRDWPSSGSYFDLLAHKSLDSFGADEEYQQWQLKMSFVRPFGPYRVASILYAGSTSGGDSTIAGLFQVGGGPTLMGLQRGQILGQHMGVAQLFFYREYTPMPILSGYIGGLLEYGGAWMDRDDINASNSIGSASIFFGADTPLGPFQIGFGATDKGHMSYYTRIGHLF